MIKIICFICIIFFLTIAVLPYSLLAKKNDTLRYPGNGISLLSKNKSIELLNNEIEHHSRGNSNLSFQKGILSFNKVDSFRFKSEKPIVGEKFCLKTGLLVEEGEVTIGIGNVKYVMKKNSIQIFANDAKVYENNETNVDDIVVEAFSKERISTRFHSDKRLVKIVKIDIKTPANIEIKISRKGKGYIGPWVWLRGYM